MPSVFESLKILAKPASTPIARLGVDSPLAQLQLSSKKYFTIPADATAADGDKLGVEIAEGQGFKLANPDHKEFLEKCVARFNTSSASLKAIDTKLTASVVVGIVASSLSFLPLVGWLGIAAWGAAAYYFDRRATAYANYEQSLNLLVAACNWSLGKHNASEAAALQKDPAIRSMMTALYPVLTETQVKHLIADEIEGVFAKEFAAYEAKLEAGFRPEHRYSQHSFFTQDDDVAISKKCTEFNRCIYGHNKGGVTDFLDALASAIPDLWRMAVHGVQSLKYQWQERNHTPAEEGQSQGPSVSM